MRVVKRLTVLPRLRLIVKVAVLDVFIPGPLIGTLIRQDDLNLNFIEKQSMTVVMLPRGLQNLCMCFSQRMHHCIREGDVKNRNIVIILAI